MFPIAIYLSALLGPFVQEDVAVLTAAGAASMTMGGGDARLLFLASATGLILSDVWKYWAGRLATRHPRLAGWLEKPGVAALRGRITQGLGATLWAVRFIPGTRIAAYVGAGAAGAPFWRFFLHMAGSAIAYVGLSFGLVAFVGMAAGEHAQTAVAAVVVGMIGVALGVGWLRKRASHHAQG